MGTPPDFATAWAALPPAARRCLELAHRAWLDDGLPVGAVLTDETGTIVTEGRNRAYDPPGGPDHLQGTPLAHAELNALAAARTTWNLGTHTLWSSHRPCAMCTAAAGFTGVGTVRYLAEDPWAEATGHRPTTGLPLLGPTEDHWASVVATALFLADTIRRAGPTHPVIQKAHPETATLANTFAQLRTPDLRTLITETWPTIPKAATPP
ncbi:nucleoside deaminase [Kitasatospora sp. NPDC059722]|uniref:nucleoside deaminase n=1 Tax=unclassified Kitasatospora TaxID=2633591 RepID=UPI00365D709B